MSSAQKTGLPAYVRNEKTVYAAKITDIQLKPGLQKQHPGAATLTFGDIDSQAHLIPKWMNEQKPVVGGWFVVEDDDKDGDFTIFVPAEEFNNNYAEKV